MPLAIDGPSSLPLVVVGCSLNGKERKEKKEGQREEGRKEEGKE